MKTSASSDGSLDPRSKRARPDIERDVQILTKFIEVYCEKKHSTASKEDLCTDCDDLLKYGLMRLEKCPYNPKPKCRDCETHCYKPEHRKKVQEVMRFSGAHFVKRGRLDWLVKYFF